MMGSFERWPGFLRLKQRLEFLAAAMQLNVTGSAFLAIDLSFERGGPIDRVYARDLDIFFPSNRQEFEKIGFRIPLSFVLTVEESKAKPAGLIGNERVKRSLHRVAFWAYSGPSNSLVCTYNAQILNEGTTEIYIEPLGEGRYVVGLEANGNLFDSLLISDEFCLDDLRPRERPSEGIAASRR